MYITGIQVLWCETAVLWDTRGQPAYAALGSGKEESKGAENTLSTVGISKAARCDLCGCSKPWMQRLCVPRMAFMG